MHNIPEWRRPRKRLGSHKTNRKQTNEQEQETGRKRGTVVYSQDLDSASAPRKTVKGSNLLGGVFKE